MAWDAALGSVGEEETCPAAARELPPKHPRSTLWPKFSVCLPTTAHPPTHPTHHAGLESGERKLPVERPQAMLSAKDLPRCDLSDHLEARLERALQVHCAALGCLAGMGLVCGGERRSAGAAVGAWKEQR